MICLLHTQCAHSHRDVRALSSNAHHIQICVAAFQQHEYKRPGCFKRTASLCFRRLILSQRERMASKKNQVGV